MAVRNVHDSGYKKVFANRTFFRQLMETLVNSALDAATWEKFAATLPQPTTKA